jgi:predicted 2-oxoglutarate/Fe(II)-dependent dioxygenase YbiX
MSNISISTPESAPPSEPVPQYKIKGGIPVHAFAPDFTVESTVNPKFHANTLAGHQFFLIFIPGGASSADGLAPLLQGMLEGSEQVRQTFNHRTFFIISGATDRDAAVWQKVAAAGYTIFWDTSGEISQLYGFADANTPMRHSFAMLLDINMRIAAKLLIEGTTEAKQISDWMTTVSVRLPVRNTAQRYAEFAPVMMIPNVFTTEQCRGFIDYYDRYGGSPSGFMRDVNGRTVGIMDKDFKRRTDCTIRDEDEPLKQMLRNAIMARIAPEILKATWFRVTRIERFLIACYDSADYGKFGAHRDNTSLGTAHRRFAVSINLNSEEFEGGELRFPEYGPHVYKPPTGAAVVFSCALLHEATPVTAGKRYAVLPFLYDDAAAKIRQQNLQYLDSRKTEAPLVPA